MKSFILLLSHILNLILVFILAFATGTALGHYNPNGIVSEIYECAGVTDKKKENKEDKVIKMGFHLED